jgi:hypothetical protein
LHDFPAADPKQTPRIWQLELPPELEPQAACSCGNRYFDGFNHDIFHGQRFVMRDHAFQIQFHGLVRIGHGGIEGIALRAATG